ncbi:DUF2000 family protein [uncultured Faecalibaculum sp.]|uniref:DUF2000 family protein n=1 Tax=uncultured Faecalibaculum sp. TaxID=1729681 RepID=UPI003445D487
MCHCHRQYLVAGPAGECGSNSGNFAGSQSCRTYEEYLSRQKSAAGQAAGVLLVGPEKTIRKLTGSLPLLK